jgi:hypothetical protein
MTNDYDNEWSCEVKRLLVEDFLSDNMEAEWEHHATLPTRACCSAFSPLPLFK